MFNRPIEISWLIAIGVVVSWIGVWSKSVPVIFTGFGMFLGFTLSMVAVAWNEARFGKKSNPDNDAT
ncbi:MAG: hypothetical protein ACI9BS_001406 [Candidatus Poriferisodalaceae bacterium]|jgi:hypothetical protein|tara:strand:+ start:3003 stop:3203 length:201 start_codon:yes stop_codon:yes gene_type:complete